MSQIAVIVVAAGKGERFAGEQNKAFAKLDGRALFLRSLEHFINRDDVCQTILVVAPGDEEIVKEKYGPNLGLMGIKLALGGAERIDSVANGLAQVSEEAQWIAIHDAARPCASTDMIDRVFAEADKSGAAILAAQLRGTIKRVIGAGIIDETLAREGLWEAQTPQVFKRQVILDAYANLAADLDPTDDAQVVELAGHPVSVVESDLSNLKVTVSGDVALATAVLKSRPKPKPKGPLRPFEEAQW